MSLRKTQRNAIITCRISTRVVAAPNFAQIGWDDEAVFSYASLLRQALLAEIRNYKKIRRDLARKTYGSAWFVIVNPVDAGWELQTRQLFVTKPKAKKPVYRAKNSSSIFLQSAKITDIDAVVDVAGAFVEYPRGLLIGYVELAAAALHARSNLRLYNATGCLYRRNTAKKRKEETKFLPDVP